ncbi:TPA: YcgJ family protein [Serratia marcescens]|uniref:YcgJ family protein n=1 Tax=Serratia TaxID=613 RepID=UPI00069C3C8C|nr:MULTISPECIES: YcgJ family protein [Serratia]MBH2927914.1 hypothetical protein [Serratia ureilytica]
MNKLQVILALSLAFVTAYAGATDAKNQLQSPSLGVVCDKYFCADTSGVSVSLTEKYLGKKRSLQLTSQGEFDHSEFTFANGIFCDVKEKVCRKDRYYGVDGKRGGAIDQKTTSLLFGQKK